MNKNQKPFQVRYFIASLLSAYFISSCSSFHRQPSSTPLNLVIIGTNDIHGKIAPEVVEVSPRKKVELGGMVWLSSYLDAYRKAYGLHVLWLDAGDQFQGTLDSNPFEGKPVVQGLNQAGLQAAAIGNHEFDFGPKGDDENGGDIQGALKARMKESHYDWLAANVFLKDKESVRPQFPNFFHQRSMTLAVLK